MSYEPREGPKPHTIYLNRERRDTTVRTLPVHWPKTRGECEGADDGRMCPHLACRYNLSMFVTEATKANGELVENIHIPHPSAHDPEMVGSVGGNCALDMAERGGMTLEEVGEAMNLTRERVRQIEASALRKVRHATGVLDVERAEQLIMRQYADTVAIGDREEPGIAKGIGRGFGP